MEAVDDNVSVANALNVLTAKVDAVADMAAVALMAAEGERVSVELTVDVIVAVAAADPVLIAEIDSAAVAAGLCVFCNDSVTENVEILVAVFSDVTDIVPVLAVVPVGKFVDDSVDVWRGVSLVLLVSVTVAEVDALSVRPLVLVGVADVVVLTVTELVTVDVGFAEDVIEPRVVDVPEGERVTLEEADGVAVLNAETVCVTVTLLGKDERTHTPTPRFSSQIPVAQSESEKQIPSSYTLTRRAS